MNYGIILAAGSGTRMKNSEPKVLRIVAGNTALWHVIRAFNEAITIDKLVLVVPIGMVQEYTDIVAEYDFKKSLDIVEGKDTRMKSALTGLRVVERGCDMVAVHDAARLLISPEAIDGTLNLAKEKGGAVTGGPIFDTVKVVEGDMVVATPDRSKLRAAYTPQIFKHSELLAAYTDAIENDFSGTDCASVMERMGYPVAIYDTNARDIKITIEQDVVLAEAIMSGGSVRCGTGVDTHRLVEGRKLILGGVDIPYEKGLLGHSDADVLVHAIMDALLGAAGMRDIGYHFPDTDVRYKGASSIMLLGEVAKLLADDGFSIINIDATIVCQKPKLLPYNDEMTKNIADTLGIDTTRINIKATTTEGIGEHGNGAAISSMAICSLRKA